MVRTPLIASGLVIALVGGAVLNPVADQDRRPSGVIFRVSTELFGLLDRLSWPPQVERSRWYGTSLDLMTRSYNPLAGN